MTRAPRGVIATSPATVKRTTLGDVATADPDQRESETPNGTAVDWINPRPHGNPPYRRSPFGFAALSDDWYLCDDSVARC